MTAVAGRRMAETVARRGGLVVLPQDVDPTAVAEIFTWVKSRHPVWDTPLVLTPVTRSRTRSTCCPSARTARWWSWTRAGRPVGVVDEAACAGVDRFTRLARGRHHRPGDPAAGHRAAGGVRPAARAPGADRAGGGRRRPARRGAQPQVGALRAELYRPALDDAGKLRVAAAIGVNGDPATRAKELVDGGVDVLVVDTAHGHQEKMITALRQVRAAAPDLPLVAGNVVTAAGRARPGRGGRGRDQGRRRAGRDVHDADDDRRRPAAVLGGRRVRGAGPRAGQARVGRRRRAAPARCRAGAGGGRARGDGRLVVRRHLRVARRPATRRAGPARTRSRSAWPPSGR